MSFPWSAFTDRGNVASTVLDSLADATLSSVTSAIDNSTNLDTHCVIEINLGSLNPTGSPYLELYMIKAPDGTNYEDAPVISGTNVNTLLFTIPVKTGSATKRIMTPLFEIPPFPLKWYVGNQLNVAMAASGNTIDVYTGRLTSA